MIVAISEMVARIGEELRVAARDVEDLEVIIGQLGSEQISALQQVFELQRLDMLRQHLAELSRFMTSIAPRIEDAHTVNMNAALSEVLLGDLKHRLLGEAAQRKPALSETGDCEML